MRREASKRMRLMQDEPKLDENAVDWTELPDDIMLHLFSCLNKQDRASLSSTCHSFRAAGASRSLWRALDIRPHRFSAGAAMSLSRRCRCLLKLQFSGAESASSVFFINATNLREISGDHCRKVGDATLSAMASQYEKLESFQLGPDCERISSDGIKQLAIHCCNLQKLRLSGIRDISANAINALAQSCTKLFDIGFMDCLNIDELTLGHVTSLRLLSVAGTTKMQWKIVLEHWVKLPNLVALDVSRTDIILETVNGLLSASLNLEIVCALHCPAFERDANVTSSCNHTDKILSFFTDIPKKVASLLLPDSLEKNGFADSQNPSIKDKKFDEVVNWVEWVLSHTLVCIIAESNPPELDNFWLTQGVSILLNLLKSPQQEVQERAATGLATLAVIKGEVATVNNQRALSVMQNGGIRLLLNLAKSLHEGLQTVAAKAIANLSIHPEVAKAVADEEGIDVIIKLAKSKNRFIAEEAAGGLRRLSVCDEHKSAIVLAGGVQALVNLISKWLNGGDRVSENAAGALANLAADNNCSMEIASAGGIHKLTTLLRDCKADGVREQAARALGLLAENNPDNTAQEPGAIEALLQLTQSSHDGARVEAVGALWILAYYNRYREAIAASGGVKALVNYANSCLNSSTLLQLSAAGALWRLSLSEAHSIAVGREGGVAPLVSFARSDIEDIRETAAGALWSLALSPGNALRIVEEGGVQALVSICSTSLSKMARFMATITLAFMFDGRMERFASIGTPLEGASKTESLDGPRRLALEHIDAFILSCTDPPLAFFAASRSSTPAALASITEAVQIHEAGNLMCSELEIELLVAMLQNPSSVLRGFGAFALLQFTVPAARIFQHISSILQRAGAPRILRRAAAATTTSLEAKVLARIVLHNLELHQTDAPAVCNLEF